MGSMTTTMKYCFIQGRTQSCRLYLYVGSEYSDISKRLENFISQTLGFLKRFYAVELRDNIRVLL
jgi:hypothetical protein